ncbi:alpha/beta hydrolase [Sideroxydans sp. CL21]|uniref:alpha/beta hydrolase n=1 Tax=Sideroxydans sp. CL21 TaxID=2600596 RepID=UPI0024BC8D78|nr:alpha/beta hydrolase [Sideroxydans sp. CL21]
MANEGGSVRITFSETMRGYASAAQTTFADGYTEGRKAGNSLSIDVSVLIPDLAHFLDEPAHIGTLSGELDSLLLGGVCPVQSGVFRLLPDTADLDRKVMYYQLYALTPQQEPVTFVGVKQVQHDQLFDLWHDTTTLYVNIYRGHVDPDKAVQAELWVTGIIGLGVADFIRVLGQLRATASDGSSSLAGLARFGRFFAGKLWDVYAPSLPLPPNRPERRYPRFTTEGVSNAAISVHPFSTGDGLTLQLTRFRRSDCDDVVLLVHGLTSSSDMFIMPEHQNLAQTLLDQGYGDVWTLDYRGSCRFPYNLARHRYNFDDIALFDHPAAIAELRKHIGPDRRIHIVAHCVGALTVAMSLFGKTIQGISSAILNSVALTPEISSWARVKLAAGPWASDYLLGIEYFSPSWRRQRGWSAGKLLALGADFVHKECDSPECHMLSFMWGNGRPALFDHANIAPETHDRLGDLFGGTGVHYYRHVLKMVRNNNAAIKYDPSDPRYAALPDDYFRQAVEMTTPILLTQGQDNRVFMDSNIICHQRLEKISPGRHRLQVFTGYGHQDVFMGKNVHADIFPRLIAFLREHSHG